MDKLKYVLHQYKGIISFILNLAYIFLYGKIKHDFVYDSQDVIFGTIAASFFITAAMYVAWFFFSPKITAIGAIILFFITLSGKLDKIVIYGLGDWGLTGPVLIATFIYEVASHIKIAKPHKDQDSKRYNITENNEKESIGNQNSAVIPPIERTGSDDIRNKATNTNTDLQNESKLISKESREFAAIKRNDDSSIKIHCKKCRSDRLEFDKYWNEYTCSNCGFIFQNAETVNKSPE